MVLVCFLSVCMLELIIGGEFLDVKMKRVVVGVKMPAWFLSCSVLSSMHFHVAVGMDN